MNKVDKLLEDMSTELLETKVEMSGKDVTVDGIVMTFGEFKRKYKLIWAAMKKVDSRTSAFIRRDQRMDVVTVNGGWHVTPDFGKTTFVRQKNIK